MKKKAYIEPTVALVNIKPTTIIASSIKGVSGIDGLGRGDDMSEGQANSRSGDFWDDED